MRRSSRLVSGVAFGSAAVAAAGATRGAKLELYYDFDTANGLTVPDRSGNGRDGTLVGGAAITALAAYGAGALNLDGVDDHVAVPAFDLGDKVTIIASVRPAYPGRAGFRPIVANVRPAPFVEGFKFGIEQDDALYDSISFQHGIAGSGGTFRYGGHGTTPPLVDGRYHQVGVAFDRMASFGDVIIRDGQFVRTSVLHRDQFNVTDPLRVGATQTGDAWFTGQIDELRIYSGLITEAELRALPEPASAAAAALAGGLLARRRRGCNRSGRSAGSR